MYAVYGYTRIWAISWIWGIRLCTGMGLYLANSSEAHRILHIGPERVWAKYRPLAVYPKYGVYG